VKSTFGTNPSFTLVLASLTILCLPCEATTSYSITLSPTPLTFGNVAVGNTVRRTESVNNAGWKTVTLTGAVVSGTGFMLKYHPTFPYKLVAGTSVGFRVSFAPQSRGNFTGAMTVRYKYLQSGSWHWTSRTVQIEGTGTTNAGSLTASPTTENFGTVQISTTKALSETVTNSGSSAITISQITTTGTGYNFNGINPPVTLSSGQSASFKVTFKPQASGTTAGKLTISSNASNPTLSVSLSGTGSVPGKIAVSPSNLNFGNVVDGSRKSLAATVSAVNGPVTVSAANLNGSEFSVSGISFPFTLSSGQTASYRLVFAPSASGTTSASATWLGTASNSPVTQSLTGTGTPPPQHSVTLNWHASTSSNVVGYNVYRGTQSGGPYAQINSALDTATTDVDYTVSAGQTYYYVVTALNASSQESGYSNQIKAVIPSP
jgi:hypothetical protein